MHRIPEEYFRADKSEQYRHPRRCSQRGRYQATLTFRKQRYYLGRFTTLEEAAKARAAAEESVAGYLAECEKNKEVLETI